MCERLYQNNVYMTECDSIIADIPESGCVILDRTIFFPEGGGQPCDTGTIGGREVIAVYESDGRIFHRLAMNGGNTEGLKGFEPGQAVHCILDWDRRFDHMQRHCSEHILSGIFFREYGGVNRGFHMGDTYMTIDIDLPSVTGQMAALVEYEANKVIWADAPVTVRYFPSGADANHLPLRKELVVEGNVSIVCVGNEEHPADCVACCGTHPDSAGQVGLIKILKIESYKGMSRIYFEAGKRAYLDYAKKHDLIVMLMEKYSSDEATLLDKMRSQDEKNGMMRQELHKCKEALTDKEAASLLEAISVPGGSEGQDAQIIVREYEDLSTDDLQALAKKICAASANLFILVSMPEKTLVLCTGNKNRDVFDCGKLIREHAGAYAGKGGGNAALARAAFKDYDDIDGFISRLLDAL